MSQTRTTRPVRRPELKLIQRSARSSAAQGRGQIVHDARGSAIWVGEPSSLEDTSSLVLAAEVSTSPVDEGDPYNRPARPTALKTKSR